MNETVAYFAGKIGQSMKQQINFRRINVCVAWLVFAIAAIVYGLTVEPTASLWDCPEFIACGYKLEIGHPPGAPFFMLVANLFAQLAGSPSQVALTVNLLSALLSAGCIFFLFLTITHLARRLVCPTGEVTTLDRIIGIEACGVIGALAYAFSDTFWFSAVEAEVYAFSSFLTAMMFWLILKWEDEADTPQGDRWIVLIAYITGLSVGVHLLCLLCLPAMSFVVYFRKAKRITRWGMLKTLGAGILLLGIILYGIIPGVVTAGGWMELLFTNVLLFPYHTGLACYAVLLTCGLLLAYYKAGRRALRLPLACLMMILAGYSSYGVILIRANANMPMCENAPGNIFALKSYLSREQYGDVPLFYGPSYCSEPDYEQKGDYLVWKHKEGSPVYRPSTDKGKTHYNLVRHDVKYQYRDNMFFPRMHSARHARVYDQWRDSKRKGTVPSAAENLRFFLGYQVNFMYWRYFLWNFVGRQNNIQGHGEVEHGNWITGIGWIDNWLLGCDVSQLPSDLKQNKGRNVFYALPLLLGLAGIAWQWRRGSEGKRQLLTVLLLFVMTGLAIVVYLNQTPMQPRERDYAYAGSFYAFALWIGLGVGMIWEEIKVKSEKIKVGNGIAGAVMAGLIGLIVPLQMVSQTWDDHDRSGRYTCRDFGANYLNSMPQEGNPVILTNGDNDTFPLWYNHEVEGVRTDTRACNLEYVQTDWYIDQMRRPAYDSPALPVSWCHDDYLEGRREVVPVRPELKEKIEAFRQERPDEAKRLLGENPFEVRNILDKWILNPQEEMQCIPTDSMVICSDEGDMVISLRGVTKLCKKDLMVLEILSKADWKRPIYTSIGLGSDNLPYLRDHLVLEGLAYRISPKAVGKKVDVERLYDNIMHRFRYGGLTVKGLYVDEDVKRLADIHQTVMGILIDSLLKQGDTKRALAVCRKWQHEMPQENVPYTDAALSMARCFYVNGLPEDGDEIVGNLLRRSDEWLAWAGTIRPERRPGSAYSRYIWFETMERSLAVAVRYDRKKFYYQYGKRYEHYATQTVRG